MIIAFLPGCLFSKTIIVVDEINNPVIGAYVGVAGLNVGKVYTTSETGKVKVYLIEEPRWCTVMKDGYLREDIVLDKSTVKVVLKKVIH